MLDDRLLELFGAGLDRLAGDLAVGRCELRGIGAAAAGADSRARGEQPRRPLPGLECDGRHEPRPLAAAEDAVGAPRPFQCPDVPEEAHRA